MTASLAAHELLQYLCLELPMADADYDDDAAPLLAGGTITGTGGIDVESGRKKLFAGCVGWASDGRWLMREIA